MPTWWTLYVICTSDSSESEARTTLCNWSLNSHKSCGSHLWRALSIYTPPNIHYPVSRMVHLHKMWKDGVRHADVVCFCDISRLSWSFNFRLVTGSQCASHLHVGWRRNLPYHSRPSQLSLPYMRMRVYVRLVNAANRFIRDSFLGSSACICALFVCCFPVCSLSFRDNYRGVRCCREKGHPVLTVHARTPFR